MAGFKLSHIGKIISLQDYLKDYYQEIFIDCCKTCHRYGKTWACPPYDFSTQEFLGRFGHAMLIGTLAEPDEATRAAASLRHDNMDIMKQGLIDAWHSIRPFMMECEERHQGAVSLCGPVACSDCEGCMRPSGKPCRHPELMRHSLESLGFDVGKTTTELLGIELKWAKRGELPPYLTLVTMLLSPDPLDEELTRLPQ